MPCSQPLHWLAVQMMVHRVTMPSRPMSSIRMRPGSTSTCGTSTTRPTAGRLPLISTLPSTMAQRPSLEVCASVSPMISTGTTASSSQLSLRLTESAMPSTTERSLSSMVTRMKELNSPNMERISQTKLSQGIIPTTTGLKCLSALSRTAKLALSVVKSPAKA